MEYFLETTLPAAKIFAQESSAAPTEAYRIKCASEQAVIDLQARIMKEIPEDLRTALWGAGSSWQLHKCTNNEPAETRTSCEIVPLK